jgi:hypothetical protein
MGVVGRSSGAGPGTRLGVHTLTCLPALLDALPSVGDALGHIARAENVALIA